MKFKITNLTFKDIKVFSMGTWLLVTDINDVESIALVTSPRANELLLVDIETGERWFDIFYKGNFLTKNKILELCPEIKDVKRIVTTTVMVRKEEKI